MKKAFKKVFLTISMISLFLGLFCVPAFATSIDISINTSGSNYTFSTNETEIVGTGYNPTLRLTAGETYTFTHNGGSTHPFKITIAGTEYRLSAGNSVTFTVPIGTTNSGSYVCTNHSTMSNAVYINAASTEPPSAPTVNLDNNLTFNLSDLDDANGIQYSIDGGNNWINSTD